MARLEDLCQQCGLCCDGTLFTRVPVRAEEIIPEAALAVVTAPTGARHVPQRCAALEGCRCSVYDARPFACRRYECLLYAAFREDEVSLDDALQVIARAKHLQTHARAPELQDYLSFHFGRRH